MKREKKTKPDADAGANELTEAQRKRAAEAARKKALAGTRYRGDRWKTGAIGAAILVGPLLGLVALGVAGAKPGAAQVDARVAELMKDSGRDFPRGDAVMWAGQVIRVWGTWNEENPDARRLRLAPFLSAGMQEQAGWSGKGSQEVIYASVNPEPLVSDANRATVNAVYQIGDGSWRCVAVPVYAYKPDDYAANMRWAFALSGNPAPVSCNQRTGAPSISTEAWDKGKELREDSDLGGELQRSFFPPFFAAWAASDAPTLQQFAASGTTAVGLGGAMQSSPQPAIGEPTIWVPKDGPQDGVVYTAFVPVTWTLAGSTSQVSATYQVEMKKQGDRWYVAGEPQPAQQDLNVVGSGNPAPIPDPGKATPNEYPAGQASPTPRASEATPAAVADPTEEPSG